MSLVVIPLGLLIGTVLGALGGGGAILTVPVLVYALGQDPRTATTSSLLIVGTTSLLALAPHACAGHVRFGHGLLFGALGAAGSFAGSAASTAVPPQVLLTAFAALLLAVAVSMLRRSADASQNTSPRPSSGSPAPWSLAQVLRLLTAATAVGAFTGFFGVGGGFLLVPALVLVLGYRMPVAVGTSLLVISLNSATALIARMLGATGVGSLDWALIGGFTGAAVLGSLLGARVSAHANPAHLTRAFAALLLLVAFYTATRSVPALL